MKTPVEISIEREEPEDMRKYEVVDVSFDERIIETYHAFDIDYADEWLRYMARDHRKRRTPLVAGIAAYLGERKKGRTLQPICAIALCLGGSHVLVFHLDDAVIPPELRDLLENPRMSLVGVQVNDLAKRLDQKCSVKLKKLVELRCLFSAARGKEKAWWWTKEGRGLEMVGVTLDEMAQAVVTGGQPVERKPSKHWVCTWPEDMTNEQLMNIAVDAFLCFEIGVKCMEMSGRAA